MERSVRSGQRHRASVFRPLLSVVQDGTQGRRDTGYNQAVMSETLHADFEKLEELFDRAMHQLFHVVHHERFQVSDDTFNFDVLLSEYKDLVKESEGLLGKPV